MAEGKIGVVRIVVDGDWDMEDLRSLSESMSESTGCSILSSRPMKMCGTGCRI
jgi:hypothetical protein